MASRNSSGRTIAAAWAGTLKSRSSDAGTSRETATLQRYRQVSEVLLPWLRAARHGERDTQADERNHSVPTVLRSESVIARQTICRTSWRRLGNWRKAIDWDQKGWHRVCSSQQISNDFRVCPPYVINSAFVRSEPLPVGAQSGEPSSCLRLRLNLASPARTPLLLDCGNASRGYGTLPLSIT